MVNGWEILICVCICCPVCACVCAFIDSRRAKAEAKRRANIWQDVKGMLDGNKDKPK